MRRLLESRLQISLLASLVVGVVLLLAAPFSADHWLFQILREDKPSVFFILAGLHNLFLFTTPFWIVMANSPAPTLFSEARPSR